MDRSIRTQKSPTSISGDGLKTREAKAVVKPHCRHAQKTSTTAWRTETPFEGRSEDPERVVGLFGSQVLFIAILVLSLWMIVTQQVPTAPTELPKPWRVDILHGKKVELMLLNGIGTSLADRIIEYRETHVLNTPEDLLEVHGIGPVKVERLRRTIVFTEDP